MYNFGFVTGNSLLLDSFCNQVITQMIIKRKAKNRENGKSQGKYENYKIGIVIKLTFFQELPMKSALGRMPYVDIIWNKVHSNAERKTLKLVCKSFWDCHVADKYKNNYSETQKLAMEHVYCRGDCPNSERYKVK